MRYWPLTAAVVVLLAGSVVHAEEAATPAASAPAASVLSVEIKIGTGMENRELVGEADTFGAEVTDLVGWTRVKGAGEPTEIFHVWKYNGEEAARVRLSVQSSNFRTYSRKKLAGRMGKWTLSVEDSAGNVLGTKDVTVGAAQ